MLWASRPQSRESNFSKVTLGTAQLGMPYGVANRTGVPELAEVRRMVKRALELGVNTFDTAPGYGESEQRLGHVLDELGATQSVNLLSKVSLGDTGGSAYDSIASAVRDSVVRSLIRLRTERLAVCFVHRFADLEQHGRELLEELHALKREGMIDAVGVSIYHPQELNRVLVLGGIDAVQLPVHLLDTRWVAGGGLSRAVESGVTVFGRSVFLQGLLLLKPSEAERKVPGTGVWVQLVHRLAADWGLSVKELAVRYIRSFSPITSIVVGAETLQQVEETCALVNSARPLEPWRIATILETFSDVPATVFSPPLWPRSTSPSPPGATG